MKSKRNNRNCQRKPQFESLEDRRYCAVASMGWDGPGKGSAALTYYIGNTPSTLSRTEVEAAIKTALDAWSKVVDIKFTQTNTPGLARSLDFTFGNIDGANGTLAQAYFPADVNNARIAGDVKFDSSEKWEIGNAQGSAAFDLVRVAVHEIGHALGLEHSNDSTAILAPTVSPNETFTQLDADDVDAILALYAPATGTNSATPTTSNPTTPTTPTTTTTNTTPTTNTPTTSTPTFTFQFRFNRPTSFSYPASPFSNGSFWTNFARFFTFSNRSNTSLSPSVVSSTNDSMSAGGTGTESIAPTATFTFRSHFGRYRLFS